MTVFDDATFWYNLYKALVQNFGEVAWYQRTYHDFDVDGETIRLSLYGCLYYEQLPVNSDVYSETFQVVDIEFEIKDKLWFCVQYNSKVKGESVPSLRQYEMITNKFMEKQLKIHSTIEDVEHVLTMLRLTLGNRL